MKSLLFLFLTVGASAIDINPSGIVTTNANLTGPITSVGNATTIVGPVPAAAVDLSTVTTAIALKADLASPSFTGAFAVSGTTLTVAATGIITAPSQPGARVDTLNTGTIVRAVFQQLYWANSSGNGSYNRQGTFVATSSDTFTARGAGLYFIYCQIGSIPNTGTNNTMKIYASVNGTVVSEKMSVPFAAATWSADLTEFMLLADGDTVTFKVFSDEATNNPLPTNNNKTNFAIVQRIW